MQFGFHAVPEAALVQTEVTGVAAEGGDGIVGAAPFGLAAVELFVHLPISILIAGAAGRQGCGHGVLVLLQGQVEVDEADLATFNVFLLQALGCFGKAAAGGALVVGEFPDHHGGVFITDRDAVLVKL